MNQEKFKRVFNELKTDRRNVDYHSIIKESVERNSVENTRVLAIEEMGELTQQLTKALRGKKDEYHLLEELADVLICIDKLCAHEGISRADLYTALHVKALEIEKEKK